MMSQKQQRIYLQNFLSLSHILLLPRRKPYFSSAISLRETTKPLPGGERKMCVCVHVYVYVYVRVREMSCLQ